MAYTDIPVRVALVDSNAAADINALMDNFKALLDGTKAFTDLNITNDLAVGGKITVVGDPVVGDGVFNRDYGDARYVMGAFSVSIKTANYTILDGDAIDIIEADSRTGDVTITLPTLADNQGRPIRVQVPYAGGKVTLDGEGAETINGDADFAMLGKDDFVLVYAGLVEWKKTGFQATYRTGMINRSDWTNVHMGTMNVTYDTLVGAFTVGEVVTFASGVTGIVQADSGTVLKLKNMTGVGYGVNNETITGATSGATALVDEAGTGSSKNLDSNLFHDLGIDKRKYIIDLIFSTDGTYNNSFVIPNTSADYGLSRDYGYRMGQVDIDNFLLQTGANGIVDLDAVGVNDVLASDDWYYEAIIRRVM